MIIMIGVMIRIIFILVIIRIIMIMIGNFERTGLLSQRIFISENNDDHQHHCVDQDYTIIMIIRIIMIMIIRIIMIRIIMIGSFKRTGLLSEWIFISGQSCTGAPQFSLALYHHHIHYHHHYYDDQDHHTNYQHHYHHENHQYHQKIIIIIIIIRMMMIIIFGEYP